MLHVEGKVSKSNTFTFDTHSSPFSPDNLNGFGGSSWIASVDPHLYVGRTVLKMQGEELMSHFSNGYLGR